MNFDRKFKINGIKEYLEEITEDKNIFFNYGVLLGCSDVTYDKKLVNDNVNLLNVLRKYNIKVNKNKKLSW